MGGKSKDFRILENPSRPTPLLSDILLCDTYFKETDTLEVLSIFNYSLVKQGVGDDFFRSDIKQYTRWERYLQCCY
jgi:hypothetical protein